MPREHGIVKWFDERKNYGFIQPEVGKKDIFFHKSDLNTLEKTIEEGTRVEFDVVQSSKGQEAKNIEVLDEG